MANNPELKVRISAELNQIKQSLSTLQNDLVKVGVEGRKAGSTAGAGMDKMAGNVNGVVGALKGLVAAYATLATGRQFIQLADQAKQLEARLKLVTNSADELVRAQEALFEIAQRTRAPLKDTVDTYARFAQATKELGVSQDTLLAVSEAINQSVQLSGATAESAQAALIQLGQGIASGTLRGEELNSVLEQTPRLAQAIAAGMGVSVGELRKLGQEGEITADKVINSLLKQRDVLEREFSTLPVTVDQAFTQLGNSVAKAVGEIDAVTGSSGGLASMLQGIAEYLNSGALQAAFIDTFKVWSSAIGAIVDDMGVLLNEIGGLFSGMEDEADGTVNFITGAFRNLPANIRAFVQIMTIEFLSFFDRVLVSAAGFKDKIKAVFTDDTIDEVNKRMDEQLDALFKVRQDSIDQILAERDAHIDAGKSAVERYQKEREAASKVLNSSIGGGIKPLAPIVQKDEAAEKAAQKARDKEIEDRKRLNEQVAQDFERAQIRLADLEGQHLRARLLEIDAQYKDALERMILAGDKSGEAMIRKLINTEKTKAQFDELKRQFDQVLEDLAAKEESLANRVRIGDINQGQANVEIDAARTEAQSDAGGIAEQAGILAINNPEFQAGVDLMNEKLITLKDSATGFDLAIQNLGNSLVDMQKNFVAALANDAVDGLSNMFMDIANGSKSAGDALKDFVRGFAQSMLQIATRALATFLVLQTMDAIYPGLGQATAASMGAGVKHTGGIVGQGGTIRQVNPALFAAAPRYHSGGIAGLKPGEVPSILQKGEEVLTRDDPRHAANGGGQQGGGAGTRVINVIDPNMVSDYMSSSSGEKVLLNILQRNAGSIKQVIA